MTNDLPQILIFTLPIAVLALLIILAVWRPTRVSKSDSSAARSRDAAPRASSEQRNESANLAALAIPSLARSRQRVVPGTPAGTPARSVEDIQSALANATARDAIGEQAEHHLALADRHHIDGDDTKRLSALRSAAGLAARGGVHHVHAAARLQLAELAFESGDLTEACEQWQLARVALLASGQNAEHDALDERMRANGCPTDWVLTDF